MKQTGFTRKSFPLPMPTAIFLPTGESGHLSQIRDLYLSIINDEPVRVDVAEGRKTLEIVKGIYLSSLRGKRIYLPFEDRMYIGVDKAAPGCPDAC